MADDWGQGDKVVTSPYSQESNLKNVVAFSPQEQDDVARQENMPYNDTELDAEMKRQANNPKALAILQQEKDRRSGSSWGQGDTIVNANWGQNDQVVSQGDWGHGDQVVSKDDNVWDRTKQGWQTLKDSLSVKGLQGLGMGIADIAQQAITSTGDMALQGGPLGPMAAKVIRPNLKPGVHGIVEDMAQRTQDMTDMLNPQLAQDKSFQAGRSLLGVPMDIGGVNKVISKLPSTGQDIANVALASMPFWLPGLKGAKGVSKAAPMTDSAVSDMLKDMGLDEEAKPRVQPPAASEPPISVDSQGTAIPADKLDSYRQARAMYEKAQSEKGVPAQGELDLQPPSQPPYEKPGTIFDPENVNKTVEENTSAADAARQAALDKAFPDHPAQDILGEEYDKALEQRAQAENPNDPNIDSYQPSQGGGGPTPMKFRGPKGQRGAVGDLGDAERIDELAKNLINTNRDPGSIGAGDSVRMMNGKIARVVKTTDDGRFQVRMDDGSLDTVPRNGIDYKYQPTPSLNRVFSRQRGSGDMFNDLAKGVFKVGDMVKDVVGNMGRVIGMDDNSYRVKTDVDGGSIYSSLLRHDRILKPADEVKLADGRQGTIRAVQNDQVKVSVPRDGGYDLQTVPKSQITLMPRSTKALGGVGKAGFGQGGAINLRNIFKGAEPGVDPVEPKPVNIPLEKGDLTDILHRAWFRASDFADFRDSVERQATLNSAFPNEVLNRLPEIYDRFESGYIPESTFGKLPNLTQRDAADLRSFKQFFKDRYGDDEKQLTAKHDIGPFKQEVFAPQFLGSMDWAKEGSHVVKWAYSNAADIRQEAGVVLNELMDYKNKFMDLSRKDKLGVVRHAWGWDSNPLWNKELVDKGLDWPTKEMLKEKGLSEAGADAYLDLAKGYDRMYQIAGIVKPKLPGYFHHSFTGAYKAYIKHPEAGIIKILPFATKRMAEFAVNEAKEHLGLTDSYVQIPKVSTRYNFVNAASEMIKALHNRGKLGELSANLLTKLQDRVMQGTITESLERHGISGWDFENGPKPEDGIINKMINRGYNNNMMNVFDSVMQDGVRAWKNRKITESIANPFFTTDKFDNMPNTISAVKDIVSKATGFSAQEYRKIDRAMRNAMIDWFGVNPNIPSNILNYLNGYIRFARTNSLNPMFALEHFLFTGYGITDLLRAHVEKLANGEPAGNFTKSMGKFMEAALPMDKLLSAEDKSALQWYANKGGFKTNYYDLPQFRGMAGNAANMLGHGLLDKVIQKAKKMTFLQGYTYFKEVEGMSVPNALEAAYNHTSKTMQSFDALDRPEVFQEGIVGKSIGPFNQIHTYNFARRLQALQAIVDIAKKNPKYLPLAIGAGVLPMVLDLSLGGMKSLPFHNDWDNIREWMLKNGFGNPDYLGSYEENALNVLDWVDKKAGSHIAPSVAPTLLFGAVPLATGADIRGTFGTNIWDAFGTAGIGAGFDLARLLIEHGRKALTGESNYDKEYQLQRALAPAGMWGDPRPGGKGIGIPWIEDEAAKHLGGNIPQPSRLNPTSPRTDQEDMYYKIMGKRPISESIRNEQVNLMKDMSDRDKVWGQMRTRLIINKLLGFNTGSKSAGDLIDETISAQHGWSEKQFMDNLGEEIVKRKIPAADQIIREIANAKDNQPLQARLKHLLTIVTIGKNAEFGK